MDDQKVTITNPVIQAADGCCSFVGCSGIIFLVFVLWAVMYIGGCL